MLKLTTMLVTASAALALAPATAAADAVPLTADFTATDVSGTNHQWYAPGTTSTATTIAAGGSVTFNYPVGNPATTRHSVAFTTAAKPTGCTPALGATSGYPTPPARAPWVATCRFDTPGTYAFVCQIHASMRGTVMVASEAAAGGASGSVPATLALGIASSTSLGQFRLGVAADYTATMPATVTSSAGDATLTVNDPAALAPGHLINGTFVMTQPLQVKATNAANPNTSFAPAQTPVTLLTWAGPVGHDDLVVSFKQSVAVTDPLRSGVYAKTLVFTLSTTSP
jgi:plastocyanin